MQGQSTKIFAKMPKLYSANNDLTKRWYVYYSVINPETNNLERLQVYENINDFDSISGRKTAAKKLIAKYRRKLRNGWSPFTDKDVIYQSMVNYAPAGKAYKPEKKQADYSIEQYLSQALEERIKAKDLREKTISGYQSRLRIFVNWLNSKDLQTLDIKDFNKDFAQNFINDLQRHASTKKAYKGQMSSFFKDIRKKKIIVENPFEELILPKAKTTKQKRSFEESEIKLFKEYCLENGLEELWIFVRFMFYCAIRPISELRRLKVADIFLERKLILVRGEIAKNRESQYVNIPNVFIKEVKDWIQNKPKNTFLFPNKKNPLKHRGKKYFYNKHRAVLEATGLDDKSLSLYSWKYTGADFFYDKTTDLLALKKHLRHKEIKTTERYLHSRGAYNSSVIRNEFPEI